LGCEEGAIALGNDGLEAGEKNFETVDIGGKDFLNDLREVAEGGGFASDDADVV
jgi:hypothetical protein